MSAEYQRKYRKVMKDVQELMSSISDSESEFVLRVAEDAQVSSSEDDLSGVTGAVGTSTSYEVNTCSSFPPPMQQVAIATPTLTDYNADELASDKSPLSSTDDEKPLNTPDKNNGTLQEDLAHWVVDAKLSRESCNSLLALLRAHGCDLPMDSRTLLKTPRSIPFEKKCGGYYIYFGIERGLQLSVDTYPQCSVLEIQVSVDGLPLYKSSNAQFWPILCCVNRSSPFIVALFYGQSKPSSVEEFTGDFFNEMKHLQTNSFSVHDKHWPVVLHSFICDAPARAYMKNTKAHNSLFGCERCIAKGTSCKGRTTYI